MEYEVYTAQSIHSDTQEKHDNTWENMRDNTWYVTNTYSSEINIRELSSEKNKYYYLCSTSC